MTYKPKSYRRVTFTVRGNGYFPSDMLRYDRCHPVGKRDREAITNHTWLRGATYGPHSLPYVRVPYEVQLETYLPSSHRQDIIKAKIYPTYERWASFGWHVVKDSVSSKRVPVAEIPENYRPS